MEKMIFFSFPKHVLNTSVTIIPGRRNPTKFHTGGFNQLQGQNKTLNFHAPFTMQIANFSGRVRPNMDRPTPRISNFF